MKERLSEEQGLSIIYKMIESARMDISQSRIYYLIWGWMVVLASLSTYLLMWVVPPAQAHLSWPVLSVLAAAATVYFWRRQHRAARARSYLEDLLNYFWIGFTITLMLVIISGLSGKLNREAIYPLSIILYGLGAFVSGGALKFRPLVAGGIACWGLAMFAYVVSYPNQLLLLALSVSVGWLVPGYLLKKKE